MSTGSKCYLVNPYNNVVRIEDTDLKRSFIMHAGCINENKGKNWILRCLKYTESGLQITGRPLANATKCSLWTTRNQKQVAHLATKIHG